MNKDNRCTPVFAEDWLVRCLDAGTPAQTLRTWLTTYVERRSDTGQVDALNLLGLTPSGDESERDHFARAGHQVSLANVPVTTPSGLRTRQQSPHVFVDGNRVLTDVIPLLNDCPLSAYAFDLAADSSATAHLDVADHLARHPDVKVRERLAQQPNLTPRALHRFCDAEPDGYLEESLPVLMLVFGHPHTPADLRATISQRVGETP